MAHDSGYDGDLLMFREGAKRIDRDHLCFWRWLIEHGRLDHPPAGPPSGELAVVQAVQQSPAELAGPPPNIAA